METSTTRERTYTWEDPMIGFAKAQGLSGFDYMNAIVNGEIPPPPIAQTMGMGIIKCEVGNVVFSLTPQEFHYNPIGSVHGGVFATILDSAMGCALHTKLELGSMYTTLELKVNYIRPLTTKTGPVTCEGKVIHSGRKSALTEAYIRDVEGKLYAHATSTCMIFSLVEK